MAEVKQYILYLEKLLTQNGIHFQRPLKKKFPEPVSQYNAPLKTNLTPSVLPRTQVERYSRQMLLKEVQYTGQVKLANSKIAIIGCGGIGCPLGLYLGSAGVGTIGLFDSDKVELTNMHRQIGHKSKSIGTQKTKSLRESILELNPHLKIEEHPFITTQNLHKLDEYDLILDGSDNPKCRYLVNDYCMKKKKSLISGACIGWEAQITAYGVSKNNPEGPCYRCLWGNDQVSQGGCAVRGVIGMVPGIVGMIMGVEVIKILTGHISDLFGHMIMYDGFKTAFKKVKLRKRKADCIACGDNKMQIEDYDYEKYNLPCFIEPPETPTVTWNQYINLYKNKAHVLLDVRSQNMFNIANLRGSVCLPWDKLKTMTKSQIYSFLRAYDEHVTQQTDLLILCRRGNDSRRAVSYLQKLDIKKGINLKGGIQQYGKLYDPQIPYI